MSAGGVVPSHQSIPPACSFSSDKQPGGAFPRFLYFFGAAGVELVDGQQTATATATAPSPQHEQGRRPTSNPTMRSAA